MATCAELEAYLGGRMAGADLRAFEAHAATCPSCGKAMTRKQAIERAAQVLQRNASTRSAPRPDRRDEERAKPRDIEATGDEQPRQDASASRRRPLLVAAAALIGGLALLGWLRSRGAGPAVESTPSAVTRVDAARAPEPAVAEPPGPAVTGAPVAAPPVAAPPVAAPPVAAPPVAGTPVADTKAAGVAGPLPLDTDLETLRRVVASRRCAPAVDALRARVARDDTDVEAWTLLAECSARRKHWVTAIAAYEKAIQFADAAKAQVLTTKLEATRAARAAASAEVTAAGGGDTSAATPESAASPTTP